MSIRNTIPLEVKRRCCELKDQGVSTREIYDTYFKHQFKNPQGYPAFTGQLARWKKRSFPDDMTLNAGTYEGFVAHNATVQVSANGEIVQAWIKQKATDVDPQEFISAIRESVEPYEFTKKSFVNPSNMLEIPLFDMHWGIAFIDYYKPVLDDILALISSHTWKKIVIPFGQDFFHNDSIINGQTTKGTVVEKVVFMRLF